ncbi:MAG: hypothetical protein ABI867_05245 [Kofleriaceae bacterium]
MLRRLLRLALALVTIVGVAHANGRSPITNSVKFKPSDPTSLYIGSTFGLLISHDDGCTFRWVCEMNIGYGGTFDPNYAVAADGTIFATTFNGLRVSHDDGCSFTTATAELPVGDPNRLDIWIDALDLSATGEVWIGTAQVGRSNAIYVSTNNGGTFTAATPPSDTIWWKSVKVAPSNTQRVYIAGYEAGDTPVPHFEITSDGGTTFTPSALATVAFGAAPILRVMAVDPANADIVYVRSEAANPPMGDRLYRSSDGGVTFAEVLATTDTIRDTVILPSGQVLVATQLGGLFRSTDGLAFTAVSPAPQLSCLGQHPDGSLIGCGPNWDPDFMAVGRSGDGGGTWQKVWRFVELAGPIACPVGTAEHDTCDQQQWTALQAQFGATGPTCGNEIQSDPAVPPVETQPGGCCDTGGGNVPATMVSVLGLALWLGRRRRSTRRPSCSSN